MTSHKPPMPQAFYRTGPMPCPYLPGRVERNLFTEIHGPQAPGLHDRLTAAGFRRSHYVVYRPTCNGCTACTPIRVLVRRFRPNAGFRRIVRRNGDLDLGAGRACATTEQYRLFSRYQRHRHPGGEMSAMSFNDYRAMIEESAVETWLASLRDRQGRLRAVCLLDQLADGLSAVYSFFDPDEPRRGLGTYVILAMIARARQLGLKYLYLGYWLRDCEKMAYKTRFRPVEALGPDGWQLFAPDGSGSG